MLNILKKSLPFPKLFYIPCPSLRETKTHPLSIHKLFGYSLQCDSYIIILFGVWALDMPNYLNKSLLITILQQEIVNDLSENLENVL